MSDEINQQQQCQTCLVCFLTNDELCDHLAGYRSQERHLSAKLEQCRAHSSPLDDTFYDARNDDNGHTDDDVHDFTFLRRNNKPTDQLCCPHEECDRVKPFPKRHKLIRHFAKHIRCKEVCVYCFEVLTLASQYIAHADTHRHEDTTKNSYTQEICDRLKRNIAESLDNYQLEGVRTRKRTKEELARTQGARRVKAKLHHSVQQHRATNHQNNRLLSSQLPTNGQIKEPPSDISLNATNDYPSDTKSARSMQDVDSSSSSHLRFVSPSSSQVDQRQWTGESIPDALRLERTGISTISALLNHDESTSTTVPTTTQDLFQGSEDSHAEPSSGIAGLQNLDDAVNSEMETKVDSLLVPRTVMKLIKFDKHILYQILFNRELASLSTHQTTNILGKIWFGKLKNRPPFVSLSLPSILGTIVKSSGQEVAMYDTTGTCSTVVPISLIKLEHFMKLIQRDGFGDILWNDYGSVAFITIYVIDLKLIADFGQSST